MPRVLPYGVAAVVLAALVCLWPGVSKEVQAVPRNRAKRSSLKRKSSRRNSKN